MYFYQSSWWVSSRIVASNSGNGKLKQITVDIDNLPSIAPSEVTVLVVNVQNTNTYLKKYGHDMLKFIGDRTHAMRQHHYHPLTLVLDRINACVNCDRKEYFSYPELGCCICMYKKCYKKLDKNIVNRIKVGDNDGSSMDAKSYSYEEGNNVSISSTTSENSAGEESKSDNDGGHYFETNSDSWSIKSNDYLQEVKGSVLKSDSLVDFFTKDATDFGYYSNDSYKEDNDGRELGDFAITTYAG